MSNGNWTPQREAILTQRWMQGWSARQIGLELGVSRNSVIGKRIRMGLPDRVTPRNPRGTKQKPLPRAKVKSAPRIEIDFLRKPRAPARGPQSLPHDQRNWYQCPMFCAGEEGSQGYVCGNPMEFPVQKFCRDCSRFAYLPPEKRRAVQHRRAA